MLKLYWTNKPTELNQLEPMQCCIKLEIILMLEFWNQSIIPYLSHIFITHTVYGNRMYTQSTIFSSRMINFKEPHGHTCPLIFRSKIVKLTYKTNIENCLFISNYFSKKLPSFFGTWFILSSTSYNFET